MVDGCLAPQTASVPPGNEIPVLVSLPVHSIRPNEANNSCAAASPIDIKPNSIEMPEFMDPQMLRIAITKWRFLSGDKRLRNLSHYRCVPESFPPSDLVQKCYSTMSDGAVAALDAGLEQSISNTHVDG
jgi:hypothetical protein